MHIYDVIFYRPKHRSKNKEKDSDKGLSAMKHSECMLIVS